MKSLPLNILGGSRVHAPALKPRKDNRQEDFEREILELLAQSFSLIHPMCLKVLLETIEAKIISCVLSEQRGNLKRAAKILGIKYSTLYAKIKRYGIEPLLFAAMIH